MTYQDDFTLPTELLEQVASMPPNEAFRKRISSILTEISETRETRKINLSLERF